MCFHRQWRGRKSPFYIQKRFCKKCCRSELKREKSECVNAPLTVTMRGALYYSIYPLCYKTISNGILYTTYQIHDLFGYNGKYSKAYTQVTILREILWFAKWNHSHPFDRHGLLKDLLWFLSIGLLFCYQGLNDPDHCFLENVNREFQSLEV